MADNHLSAGSSSSPRLSPSMALSIPDFLVVVPALFTIPLHFAVIFIILNNLRDKLVRNMYFMLVISQCCIDIFAIICQVAFHIAPHIDCIAEFYWTMRQSSLPAWGYIHIYFFILARSIGIVLICLQRTLAISYPFSYLNMLVNSIPGICVILFHFTLSVLLPLPIIYGQKGFEFMDQDLHYKITPSMLQTLDTSRVFGAVVVLLSTIISVITLGHSYVSAAKKPSKGIRMKNDICILHVVTTYFAFFVIFACYVTLDMTVFFQPEFYLTEETEYSLVSVYFSCSHPWLIVLFLSFFRYKIFLCRSPPIPPRVTAASAKVMPIVKL